VADVPTLRYTIVDVFTDRAFAGNQLAVFTDGRGVETDTMQALARENGFSETTFVLPPEADGTARVRVFTPFVELPFAGHPILGTAWVLAAPLQRGVVALETGSGIIPVELERDETGALAFGRMTQPVPTVEPYPDPDALLAAVGIRSSALPVERYDNGVLHTFVVLDSHDAVGALRPDFNRLTELEVNVSCIAGAGTDWKTRMFAPALGVAEDPATGSAAGPLACHVCRHGLADWGTELAISQGVEIGRPSMLYARADGSSAGIERVEVGGSAVVVARGEFRL
jgi:trans-2,3-dihydro-3-hydroxyanthranilate isomerase